MTRKPALVPLGLGMKIVATAWSALIAMAVVVSVSDLFVRDGTPLEQMVIAEHACADKAFASERDACMRAFLAAAHRPAVASR